MGLWQVEELEALGMSDIAMFAHLAWRWDSSAYYRD
jgi:hypothetical protein